MELNYIMDDISTESFEPNAMDSGVIITMRHVPSVSLGRSHIWAKTTPSHLHHPIFPVPTDYVEQCTWHGTREQREDSPSAVSGLLRSGSVQRGVGSRLSLYHVSEEQNEFYGKI
jgi:hypothetical protein